MFHSSCVEKSLRAAVYLDGKENVLHDGKTKAKNKGTRERRKIDKTKLPLLPHGTVRAATYSRALHTSSN